MTSTSDHARGILGGEPVRASSGGTTPERERSAPEKPIVDQSEGPSEGLEDTFNFEEAREQALLEAYASGDAAALEELLTAHEDRIFATCLRMTGDPETARDMTQDTFLRVIQGLGQFSGKSRLSTWMTRIAINVCLSDRRRRAVRQTMSIDSAGSGRRSGSPSGGGGEVSLASMLESEREPGVSERVESKEELERMAAAMARLDPQRRAILILRDGQDLDYGEIAEVLGVPTGTVKSRLFRARVALRVEIEKLENPDAADEVLEEREQGLDEDSKNAADG